MKFILTKIPMVEDVLVASLRTYFAELDWPGLYPNFATLNISADHPFEQLLGGNGDAPSLFPSVTVVSSNDNESGGMGREWLVSTIKDGDLAEFSGDEWFVSADALAHLKTALHQNGEVHGLRHQTMWHDSVSFEIWAENMQVKNHLYSLLLGFLTGPKIMQIKQDHGITVFSNSINGQRSGYYNFDFGRVLFGGRVAFAADYPVVQAVYDTDIATVRDILIDREVM